MLQPQAGGPAPPAAGEAGGAGEGQGVLGESLFTNLNSAKTLFTIRHLLAALGQEAFSEIKLKVSTQSEVRNFKTLGSSRTS